MKPNLETSQNKKMKAFGLQCNVSAAQAGLCAINEPACLIHNYMNPWARSVIGWCTNAQEECDHLDMHVADRDFVY